MARATAAGALKLFGGVYPPPHDATSFGNLVAQADSLMDIEALPGVLSTTGTNEVALGDRVLYNLVINSVWAAAGGDLSGKPEPVVMTNQIKMDIRQLLMDTTSDSFVSLNMLNEDI